jgi:serine protease
VAGHDFVDGDALPHDEPPRRGRRSHGTHIAAIIAQTAGNGIGGAGVAPRASIMPVRVLRPDLSGTARAIARGLRFAADHGADVANLSVAGRRRSPVLDAAIRYATQKGVVVVAAAGNGGRAAVGFPAAHPDVIAVGSVTRGNVRARYANHGPELDLVAPSGAGDRTDTGFGPGDGVVGETLKGGPGEFCFCFTASTSAAAAQVSGVAALVFASGRARTPARVREVLLASAQDLGVPGRDDEYGAGLVRADRALGVRAAPPADGASTLPWLAAGLATVLVVALLARRRLSA